MAMLARAYVFLLLALTQAHAATNLALNRPAAASSIQMTGNEAARAFDGSTGTRWSSRFSDPQWISVDLGALYNISGVKLRWEAAYAKSFRIEVSANSTQWTTIYSTASGQGGINDLAGLSGTGRYVRMYGLARGTAWGYSLWEFEVYGTPSSTTPPPGVAAFPVKRSTNGRYLVDQNNKPFLVTADSPQSLVPNLTEAQADTYFANRKALGFNAAWINVAAFYPFYPSPSRSDGATYDGIRPFTGYVAGGTDGMHYDIRKPNDAYFARLDRMLALAAKHGILVFLVPLDTGSALQLLRNNGTSAAYAFGQYLGNRYKNTPNIVWMSGNDFNGSKTGGACVSECQPGDNAIVQALANGIKSVDPAHLQTVLIWWPSASDAAWAPLIQINLAYTYAATYLQMLSAYNQTANMPLILGEAHYEGEQVGNPTDFGTPLVVRRQAYWAMLSGGAGQFYGNAYIWTFKPGWNNNLNTPGAVQISYLKSLFLSLAWYNLVPDQAHALVTAGYGSPGNSSTRVSQSDYCTAAMTPDGTQALAYMPTARTITVNMAKFSKAVTASWFDPANGTQAAIAGSPFANSGTRQFTPPAKNSAGDSDWVLVLR